MLDQLLLRAADANLWRQSAHSLTYLVLDEFHTYDGAQGTDVSMLLRRLGITLKSYWNTDDPSLTEQDWARPLGQITPVATSATLGDGGDPAEMLDFAETVFGERFDPEAVITESRLSYRAVGPRCRRTYCSSGLDSDHRTRSRPTAQGRRRTEPGTTSRLRPRRALHSQSRRNSPCRRRPTDARPRQGAPGDRNPGGRNQRRHTH